MTLVADSLSSVSTSSHEEKILILCRAVPEESRAYFQTVCVAGITNKGEFRRLYPVMFKPFVAGGGIPFHKKEWIRATTLPPDDKRDTRPESRKLDISSVVVLNREDDEAIRRIVLRHLSPSVKAIQDSGASLGLLKPKIIDFECQIESTDEWSRDQVDLEGRPIGKIGLGQQSRYKFFCEERKGCCGERPHSMEIHDWEVNELYRNIIRRDKKHTVIEYKMRKKLFDWMTTTRDVFFMMGTHHRWKTWMIVSILYLQKPSHIPQTKL